MIGGTVDLKEILALLCTACLRVDVVAVKLMVYGNVPQEFELRTNGHGMYLECCRDVLVALGIIILSVSVV